MKTANLAAGLTLMVAAAGPVAAHASTTRSPGDRFTFNGITFADPRFDDLTWNGLGLATPDGTTVQFSLVEMLPADF